MLHSLFFNSGTQFVSGEHMKRNVAVFLLAFAGMNLGFAQTAGELSDQTASNVVLRTLNYNSFQAGEKLTYHLRYGPMDAGEAILSVKESDRKIAGRPLYHVVGEGNSINTFDWFFKVRDRYETYIDREGVFPWLFIRRVDEGGHKISQDYVFQQNTQQVKTEKGKTFDVPANVQDMLSAFYYARTMDYSNAQPGDIFEMQCFLDEELYDLKIKYIGKETIKLNRKKYNCLKFQPVVQTGRVFKKEDDLQVWVTDDGNKVPVLAKASILIGNIRMELTDYEGLSHPINFAN